jgi:cobalt/nickel transport system permease protein
MRPEVLESANAGTPIGKTVRLRNVIIALAAVTVVSGGLLSVFASKKPDGLEWAIEKTADKTKGVAAATQEEAANTPTTAFMPDYEYAGEEGSSTGTSVAGLAGGGLTFLLAGGTALLITALKKKRKRKLSLSE